MENIKVNFQGKKYWFLKKEDGTGPLAYLEHCDDKGNLLLEHAMSISFAHVYHDGINRFGEKIGTMEDLIPSHINHYERE